jgi:hypothetical protein
MGALARHDDRDGTKQVTREFRVVHELAEYDLSDIRTLDCRHVARLCRLMYSSFSASLSARLTNSTCIASTALGVRTTVS